MLKSIDHNYHDSWSGSEGTAVTYAKAYTTLGLPRVVFGEHNGRNK
jgi:hypothetical protein